MSTQTCNICETVQDIIIYQGYYDGLIGSHIRAFNWYQNQWPWTAEKSLLHKKFYRAHQKKTEWR